MDRLGIGDEIKVAQEKPLITVVTVERQDVIDKIPYQTHTRQNSGVFEGKEFIIQYGQFGRQRIRQMVTCENGTIVKKEVESRTVLSNPHDQISVIGTKLRH
jgi:uncharacterized protein YabE (DUF348 family)